MPNLEPWPDDEEAEQLRRERERIPPRADGTQRREQEPQKPPATFPTFERVFFAFAAFWSDFKESLKAPDDVTERPKIRYVPRKPTIEEQKLQELRYIRWMLFALGGLALVFTLFGFRFFVRL